MRRAEGGGRIVARAVPEFIGRSVEAAADQRPRMDPPGPAQHQVVPAGLPVRQPDPAHGEVPGQVHQR
ncbi:hypothetical protein, partial [Arthrobacter sp. GCM10027362]|uniref:hypothetical protein n=1 Tax=Arthrobacter sp. GCM10027362 TaxID=3273379 RepID=UPI00366CC57D